MNPNENHIHVETFLPVEIIPVEQTDTDRIRSEIVDGAVRRRGLYQGRPGLEADTMAMLDQMGRLEQKLDALLKHFQRKYPRAVMVRQVTLSNDGLTLKAALESEQLATGTWVELRFQLPTHSQEEILTLAEVRPATEKSMLTLMFVDMAADQSEWIARYLVHRQREQAMNNQCKR